MKIHSVGAELLHADIQTDGLTDRHEANSRFSKLCEKRLQAKIYITM